MKLSLKELVEGLKDTTYLVYNNANALEYIDMAYRAGLEAGISEATSGRKAPSTLEEYLKR